MSCSWTTRISTGKWPAMTRSSSCFTPRGKPGSLSLPSPLPLKPGRGSCRPCLTLALYLRTSYCRKLHSCGVYSIRPFRTNYKVWFDWSFILLCFVMFILDSRLRAKRRRFVHLLWRAPGRGRPIRAVCTACIPSGHRQAGGRRMPGSQAGNLRFWWRL